MSDLAELVALTAQRVDTLEEIRTGVSLSTSTDPEIPVTWEGITGSSREEIDRVVHALNEWTDRICDSTAISGVTNQLEEIIHGLAASFGDAGGQLVSQARHGLAGALEDLRLAVGRRDVAATRAHDGLRLLTEAIEWVDSAMRAAIAQDESLDTAFEAISAAKFDLADWVAAQQ